MNTLKRSERLKSRKTIEKAFAQGKVSQAFPLRLVYLVEPSDSPLLQAGFTVSSRHFKKAVDRNRIKRLLRESYRCQNQGLKEWVAVSGNSLNLFFIFTGRELPVSTLINEKTGLLLDRLLSSLQHENV